MVNEFQTKKFCRDDISLIENYDKAINDKTQTWHCHHRRETIFSKKDLIEIGEYYKRPACELIFLTKAEHNRLHHLGKHLSAEARKKLSEANKGKHHSAEACKKMSEAHKGVKRSAETCKKISEAKKGEKNPNFGKPTWNKGKHFSAETRKKMSEAKKGTHWYNNGVTSIRASFCPEGFVPGRLK